MKAPLNKREEALVTYALALARTGDARRVPHAVRDAVGEDQRFEVQLIDREIEAEAVAA